MDLDWKYLITSIVVAVIIAIVKHAAKLIWTAWRKGVISSAVKNAIAALMRPDRIAPIMDLVALFVLFTVPSVPFKEERPLLTSDVPNLLAMAVLASWFFAAFVRDSIAAYERNLAAAQAADFPPLDKRD